MKLLKKTLVGTLVAAAMLVMSAASNAQSINDIVKRGKVMIGVNSGAPPFSFVDADGKARGMDVDIANLLGKYLGVPAEVTTYTTAARIPACYNMCDVPRPLPRAGHHGCPAIPGGHPQTDAIL